MIKLYRGNIIDDQEDTCLFMLDSFGPSQFLMEMIKKQDKQLSDIDHSLLEKKYHFMIEVTSSSDRSVLSLLEALEKAFPQIIWTKIIKTASKCYKIEFIPIAFQNERQEEDGILADALEEMGVHAANLIPTFREKVEEVLKNWQGASPIEVSATFELEKKQEEASHLKEDTEDPLLIRLKKLQEEVKKQNPQKEEPRLPKSSFFKKKNPNKHQKQNKHENKNKKSSRLKKGSIIVGLLMFFGLCLLVLGQFYGVRTVEGKSMEPTLKNEQVIIIEKQPDQLQRGDVLAFNVPQMGDKEFVKRIIGLPGDTIYTSQGNLYVNDKPLSTDYTGSVTEDFTLKEICGRETVPEGKLFVLGDNRAHSTDSRNYGFVDQGEIKGKVVMK
jgi:signal peptidase I, bacterial type